MSDEIEDISVETESPVASAGTEAPVAVEASVEPVGAEIEATQVNLAPADDSLKQNSQQAYLETVAPERVNAASPMTAAGHAAKEEVEKAKKDAAHEHFEQEQKHAAARREWMEREHDFGGQKMSGHDLTKLMDFISNPAMQDKLRDRLGKSGMPKEKIDKGMKELQEFADLKKKEKEGDLSEEQKRRLREIEKSEEFKVVAQDSERLAREQGVQFSKEHMAAMAIARDSSDGMAKAKSDLATKQMQAQHASLTSGQYKEVAVSLGEPEPSTKPVAYVAASARDDLPQTVALTEEFTSTNARQVAAVNKPEALLSLGGDEPVSLAATANNNVIVAKAQPATVVASL